MEKKVATKIMLTLLLISTVTLAFGIQGVKASGTIYIRSDGSIEPSTAPISTADYVTYTFADNINDSIVVERNNIIIDGDGYTLQGPGVIGSRGIDLTGRTNVTVRNTQIKDFDYGIWLQSSFSNSISGNNITNNQGGIWFHGSFSNSISGNNITANNQGGIILDESSNNILSGNNVTANNYAGIALEGSSNNNIIVKNNIANHRYGICLWGVLTTLFITTTSTTLFKSMLRAHLVILMFGMTAIRVAETTGATTVEPTQTKMASATLNTLLMQSTLTDIRLWVPLTRLMLALGTM